jgi:dipeptidase
LAVDHGWYSAEKPSAFHFSKVFSKAYQDDMRQWRGLQLLTGKSDSIMKVPPEGLAFTISPKKKVSLKNIMSLLRDHYQGTVYENDAASNPNWNKFRTICNSTTQYSVIAQLRNWLPWPAGGLLWVSFGRPDCHPYLPWYTAVDSIPEYYRSTTCIQSPDSALAYHFKPLPRTFEYDPRSAFWIQNELENIIDMDYQGSISHIVPVREAIEDRLIEFQDEFESSMLRLWKREPASAKLYCQELLESATNETMQKSIRMIRYLKGMNFK